MIWRNPAMPIRRADATAYHISAERHLREANRLVELDLSDETRLALDVLEQSAASVAWHVRREASRCIEGARA